MGDFPGSPVVKTVLPMLEAWVPILVRELDPTLPQLRSSAARKKMVQNV